MQLRPATEVSWLPQPPRRSRRQRRLVAWLVAATVLLLLVFAGYTAWWLSAAANFRDGTLAWIEQRRAEGWHMTYGDVTRRGFPFALGVRFDDAVVAPRDHAWQWATARLRFTAPLIGSRPPRLGAGGDQTFEFNTGSAISRWSGRAQQMSFDIQPADGWMPNGRLAIRALSLAGDGGDTTGIGYLDFLSTGDPAAAASAEVSTWAARLTAEKIQLPRALDGGCGREIDAFEVEGGLYGALNPSPWPAALARWRDSGGVVEIERIRLACGALNIDGEGTLALDGRGQPIGAMSTHIQGYDAALDRLAAAQTIDPHIAATAKILLRALARSNADGAATLSAPLSLQDRALSLGPVTLLRLQPVHWLDSAVVPSNGDAPAPAGR